MRGKSAVALAQELLTQFGSLDELMRADAPTLARVPGIGLAKAAQLVATLELARRALSQAVREAPVFERPQEVEAWLRMQLGFEARECFLVLFLDQRHRLLRSETLFRGTVHEAAIYPREVVKAALLANASAVIVAHNHPSASPEPSSADIAITQRLREALALVDVRLLDHFIVSAQAVVSFAERGLL